MLKLGGRNLCVAPHYIVVLGLKGIVGGGVKRIFDVFASLRIGEIRGIGHQLGKFVLGILLFQQVYIALCCGFVTLTHV